MLLVLKEETIKIKFSYQKGCHWQKLSRKYNEIVILFKMTK